MQSKSINILGIETSCDETAADVENIQAQRTATRYKNTNENQ
jgi:tRNA A37 threonylcarbamoyltransferase TsaD